MLGLGSGFYKLAGNDNSGLIYKELRELDNYSDLDVHFDWSNETTNMGYAHGAAIEEADNLGAGGSTNRINTVTGNPTMDRTTMTRGSVSFDGTGDILNMAAAFTSTAKAFTLCITKTRYYQRLANVKYIIRR